MSLTPEQAALYQRQLDGVHHQARLLHDIPAPYAIEMPEAFYRHTLHILRVNSEQVGNIADMAQRETVTKARGSIIPPELSVVVYKAITRSGEPSWDDESYFRDLAEGLYDVVYPTEAQAAYSLFTGLAIANIKRYDQIEQGISQLGQGEDTLRELILSSPGTGMLPLNDVIKTEYNPDALYSRWVRQGIFSATDLPGILESADIRVGFRRVANTIRNEGLMTLFYPLDQKLERLRSNARPLGLLARLTVGYLSVCQNSNSIGITDIESIPARLEVYFSSENVQDRIVAQAQI